MSNLNDEVCEYNSTPTTEHFAGRNGWGVVYHRSDSSRGNTRWYGMGGEMSGSKCWGWIDAQQSDVVHYNGFQGAGPGDHNWTIEEINSVLGRPS